MKIVYNNPVLKLTGEEIGILNRATEILSSICDRIEDYNYCERKCPIYHCCPYHNDFTNNMCGKLHDLLANIASGAESEEE